MDTQPNPSPNPLTNLEADIRAHWTKHLPQMTAQLQARGELDAAVARAAQQTRDEMIDLMPAMDFWAAWELVREKYAFLPAEPEPDEAE